MQSIDFSLKVVLSNFSVLCIDKFSRHLIIRLPGIAFKDNINVGAFVTEVLLKPEKHISFYSLHDSLDTTYVQRVPAKM